MLLTNFKARSYSPSPLYTHMYIDNNYLFYSFIFSKILTSDIYIIRLDNFFIRHSVSSLSRVYRFLGLTVEFEGSREQSHLGV